MSYLIASSLVLGAFAQYAQMNEYADSGCSTLKQYVYYPSSSDGTCTPIRGTSAPYSVKAYTDYRIDAYGTLDCSGSVLLSTADTTTCVSDFYDTTGTTYIQMVSYDTTVPDSGLKTSTYVGADASTDTCTASYNAYFEVVPLDTCVYSSDSEGYDYVKYTSCDSATVSGQAYFDSSCSTTLEVPLDVDTSTIDDFDSCTVYNADSTTPASYEFSQEMTCASTSNSASCDGCTAANSGYLSNNCVDYTGSCGIFETDSGCWDGGHCYATSSGSCCDINGGAIAGVVIGIVAIIACVIALSCFCCASCPWAKSRANGHCQENQQPHGQPVVVVATNQPPPSMQTAQPINKAPAYQPQTAESVVQA